MRGRRPQLPGPQVRPEQQVHRQPAVARRPGLAPGWGPPHAVRPATARRKQPAAGVQGQGRRRRPVQDLAGRHLPGHRLGDQPAHRCAGGLRGPARDGGDRHGQPGREVPRRAARRAGPGRLHQGLLHQDDRRVPGAGQAAHHHADADLPHRAAGQLDGRQPRGGLQHRRDPGQRRLGHAAEQRQGAAADQRPAPGAAARYSRGAAVDAAHPVAGSGAVAVDPVRLRRRPGDAAEQPAPARPAAGGDPAPAGPAAAGRQRRPAPGQPGTRGPARAGSAARGAPPPPPPAPEAPPGGPPPAG
ncbi:hypothetical protein L839_3006 [Mycobacterium avium MAV_120809_2495]|nr:hypothetical protein L839_3006 [Mycobacterium avium MAV_120809_2495]